MLNSIFTILNILKNTAETLIISHKRLKLKRINFTYFYNVQITRWV